MTPQPVARALVARPVGAAIRTTGPDARTMTAATAVMCRMPACPATHGPLV